MVGLLLVLYFPALFLWQVVRWLDTGLWISLPAILAFTNHAEFQSLVAGNPAAMKNFAVLSFLPEFGPSPWLTEPKAWIGVHRIVMWVLEHCHIGFLSATLGVFGIATGIGISTKQADAIAAAKSQRGERT
jgi:hypothetical protein